MFVGFSLARRDSRPAVHLMKNATLALICLLAAGSFAAETPSAGPRADTLTFFIEGVECPSCIYSVWQSINGIKGVSDINVQQRIDSYATVTFDPAKVSAHQIAQAVTDAWPLHGKPYVASLTLRVPDYGQEGNAAKVDAVLAAQKPWVKFEPLDKSKGEFVVSFLPLKPDKKKTGPQGWNPDTLTRALHDSAPNGLGLKAEFEKGE